MNGFSVAQYRNANKLSIYDSPQTTTSKALFTAFYIGGMEFNFQLETGDFNNFIGDIFNRVLTSPLIKSTAKAFGGGNALSAVDSPLKPYLEGVKPLTNTFECYLPLINADGKMTDTPFTDNIITPLQELLAVALPGRKNIENVFNNGANDTAQQKSKVDEYIQSIIDWFFPVKEGESRTEDVQSWLDTLWDTAHKVGTQWWEDFGKEAYFLTEPLQFMPDHKLYLQLGSTNPIMDRPIYVTGVNVGWGPNIYSDGLRTYPAFAKVRLDVMWREKPTASFLLDAQLKLSRAGAPLESDLKSYER